MKDEGEVPRVIGGLVLAAGEASRFGSAKQLAPLDGRPLLEHAVRAITAVPVGRVIVVLGAGAEEVIAGVDLHGAEPHLCDALAGGPGGFARLRARRADGLRGGRGHLGDQPRISPDAIRRVIAARGDGALAVRATYGGDPGHPVLLERELFARMRDVTGDHGARNLLMSVPVREVPCDDLGGGEDVDTPAELDALRAGGPVA